MKKLSRFKTKMKVKKLKAKFELEIFYFIQHLFKCNIFIRFSFATLFVFLSITFFQLFQIVKIEVSPFVCSYSLLIPNK